MYTQYCQNGGICIQTHGWNLPPPCQSANNCLCARKLCEHTRSRGRSSCNSWWQSFKRLQINRRWLTNIRCWSRAVVDSMIIASCADMRAIISERCSSAARPRRPVPAIISWSPFALFYTHLYLNTMGSILGIGVNHWGMGMHPKKITVGDGYIEHLYFTKWDILEFSLSNPAYLSAILIT